MVKLFYKIKQDNKRIISFCGLNLFSYTKKNKNLKIYEFLEKYRYILNNTTEENENEKEIINSKINNPIWQYWEKPNKQYNGEAKNKKANSVSTPIIVQKCFESVKKFSGNRQVIVLNDNNISDYITIPTYILEKLKNGIITRTHFSDYLRTCLLLKYGGTWIDATVLLTDNIPNEITFSDFFVFKSILFYNLREIPSIKLLEWNNDNMSISSWFIHSKPNNMILKYTKLFLDEYWKNENKLINYFLFHYWITFLIINNKECAQIYNIKLCSSFIAK